MNKLVCFDYLTDSYILSVLSVNTSILNVHWVMLVQSAYRPYHSTKTTLLKVFNDIMSALESGNITVLTLLDVFAAFDAIDHDLLLHRLSIYLAFRIQPYSDSSPT